MKSITYRKSPRGSLSPKKVKSPKDSVENILTSPHSINNPKSDYPTALKYTSLLKNKSDFDTPLEIKKKEKHVITQVYDLKQIFLWKKIFNKFNSRLEFYLDKIYMYINDIDIDTERQKLVNKLASKEYKVNRHMYSSVKNVPISLTKRQLKDIHDYVEEQYKFFFEDHYSDIENIIEELKNIKYELKYTEKNQKDMIKDERNQLQSKILKQELAEIKQNIDTTEYLLDKALSIKFFIKMYNKNKFLLSTSSMGIEYIDKYVKRIEKYL